MELTKQGIASIRFTCKRKKYYLAKEVDGALDAVAAEADRLQTELRQLRAEVEDARSREKLISSAIVASQETAAAIVAKAEAEREALLEKARKEQVAIEDDSRRMQDGLTVFGRELTDSVNKLFACFQETIGELLNSLKMERPGQPDAQEPAQKPAHDTSRDYNV